MLFHVPLCSPRNTNLRGWVVSYRESNAGADRKEAAYLNFFKGLLYDPPGCAMIAASRA